MKEDLLRHALTASLAALLAAAGTAVLLVDGRTSPAAPAPATIGSRDDGASDDLLIEALGRVESALSGLQMSVEQAASRGRREVAVRAVPDPTSAQVAAASSGSAEPGAPAPSAAQDEPNETRPAGTVRPVDVVAVESVLERLDTYNANGVKDLERHPARSFYFRSVEDIAREFGPPTRSRTNDSGFHAYWNVPGGRYMSLEFVDGICVEFHGR